MKKLIVIAISFLLSGCTMYNIKDYKGDGIISKQANTFRIDLDTIDLHKKGNKLFKLENLPNRYVSVGFNIVASRIDTVNKTSNPTNALVNIKIIDNNNNNAVLEKKLFLNELSWQWWTNGKQAQFYAPNSGFIANKGVTYTLTVEVKSEDTMKKELLFYLVVSGSIYDIL